MLKTTYLFVLLTSLSLLSACSDLDNSTPPAELKQITQRINLSTQWKEQLGADLDLYHKLSPVIQQGSLYSVSAQGFVSKVNAQTGDLIWQKNTGHRVYAGLAVSNQYIVLLSREGEVFVYTNSKELPVIWTKNVGSELNTPALIDGNSLFIRSSNGELVSYEITTGKQNWSIKQLVPSLSITGTAMPQVYKNYVLSGFDNGEFIVLDKKTGEVIWKKTISLPKGRSELDRMNDADGKAVVQDGVIYISNYQGRLIALNILDGEELWARPMSSVKAINFDKQALYITDQESILWSIDRRNGTVLWKQDELHNRLLTAMAVLDDAVITADFEGFAHWLDKTTGKIIARKAIGEDRVLNKPLVYKKSLLFLDTSNHLTSVRRLQ